VIILRGTSISPVIRLYNLQQENGRPETGRLFCIADVCSSGGRAEQFHVREVGEYCLSACSLKPTGR